MRCKHCNVDLPETYTRCPLCGNTPSDEEPRIKDLEAIPYPDKKINEAATKPEKNKSPFSVEKIKAYFNT
ncbi:MAG: hypothetical protein IKJ27_07995 [Clostridia bacterium]|nr:hypothetical protein [Clostridia bacterium]